MPKTPSPPPTADPETKSLKSSPPKATVKGLMTFSQEQRNAEQRRLNLCRELAGNFVGPYEVSKFVDFLPKVQDRATPDVDFSQMPSGQRQEADMYEPFMKAVTASGCCPSFVLRNTSTKSDATSKVKPDCGLFRRRGITKQAALEQCMALVDIPIEFKPRATDDAFHSRVNDGQGVDEEWKAAATQLAMTPGEFMKMTNSSIKNRGQQIDYASLVMALQHRTHVFSISVNGDKARLIRWDRAGACVSEAFDYTLTGEDCETKTNWLAEFLFRYAHATPEQRGFDPNVRKATPTEVEKLDKAVKDHTQAFPYPQHLADKLNRTVDPLYPVYNVTVVHEPEEGEAKKPDGHYIICRPFFEATSLCSRATRGYLAYWVEGEKLVFLKDTWRVGDSDSEAKFYERLRANEKLRPYLPVIISCGDVSGVNGALQTQTQNIKDCDWVPQSEWLRPHVLHRIVQELAIPLHMVRSSKELLQAIRNVLIAVKVAYYETNVLHRDISINNIMLTLSFDGILNDWDHAIRTDDLTRKIHAYRTGTWQFMSINILRNTPKPHSIHDDVESAFWVFYYAALHYFKIKSHDPIEGRPNMKLFDELDTQTGSNGQIIYLGGRLKNDALTRKAVQQVKFESAPLTDALHAFANVLRKYHLWQRATDEDERALFAKAVHEIENVDPLIKIFQDLIDAGEWPQDNDAVVDQYPKKSAIDEHIQLTAAHEACVTDSKKLEKVEPQPAQADDDAKSRMPPPASVPNRRVARSTSRRKNATNAPPPVASSSKAPQAITRSTSKRHRVGDGDAKEEEAALEGSDGRAKRSRQQKPKPIARAPSQQTRYNTRSRTKST